MRGLWWRYWLQLPGLPDIGDPSQADCIAVQAFGRNIFDDADLPGIRTYHDRNGGRDELTLEWLRSHDFKPGRPNLQLARETQALVERFGIPAIVQWEVAAAMRPSWYAAHQRQVICLWPSANPGEYYSTVDVKRDTVAIMRQRGWRLPIEVAHRWMIIRAYFVLRKQLGADPVAISRLSSSDFDHESTQPWTRSWYVWLPREIAARLHHVFKRLV